MALSNAILDVRNMKRSLTLRQEPDQAKIVEVLEQILKDAVVSQASGSRTFQKKAYEEMVQIRKDLLARQINAGASQEAMVGIYSHMIDQMNRMQSENAHSSKAFDQAIGELGRSIPSVDTFISALMTANPLLGYGVKVIRDISRSSKAYSDARKREAKEKMEQLKAQESFIEKQLKELALKEAADKALLEAANEDRSSVEDAVEKGLEAANEPVVEIVEKTNEKLEEVQQAIEDSVTKNQNEVEKADKKARDPNKPKRQYTKGGIYRKILEEIRDEMVLLRREWTGELSRDLGMIGDASQKTNQVMDDSFETWFNNPYENQIGSNKAAVNPEAVKVDEEISKESTDKVVEALDKVNDSILEQTESAEDNAKELERLEEKQDQERKRDKKLEKLGEDKGPGVPDIKPVQDVLESQKGGFMKLIDGLMAPLLMMVRSTIGAFVIGVGAFLLEFVAIPAIIGTAIYKFLDGFFNAEQIIGKASKDITYLDRVKAAVANIHGTIIKMVDWVLELFGFDFIDSKDAEKKVYKAFDYAQNKIVDTFKSTLKFVQDKYETITKSVSDFFTDIETFFSNIYKFFSDKVDSFTSIFSSQGIKNWFGDTFNWGTKSPEENKIITNPQSEIYSGTVDRSPVIMNPQNLEVQQQNGKTVTDSMNRAEQSQKQNTAPAAPTIVAPSTNNNTVNNNNYMGTPSTSNKDPDFRSTQTQGKGWVF